MATFLKSIKHMQRLFKKLKPVVFHRNKLNINSCFILKKVISILYRVLLRVLEPPHDKIDMCAQQRLSSAWASAQSNQSIRCPHEETLGPQLPIERTAKTDQTGRI